MDTARTIMQTERAQATAVKDSRNLRVQLDFMEYLAKRAQDPSYGFRAHLRAIGGAIEE